MLNDFRAILLHNDSTAYFLVSFISACAQFIARAALYVIDNDGSIKSSAVAHQLKQSSPLNHTLNFTQAVYYLSTNNALKACSNLPGPCTTYSHNDLSGLTDSPIQLCGMIAEYTATQLRENSIEDMLFVALHAALIFITIYAIARESVPHIVTIFFVRVLNMIWSISRFVYTVSFLENQVINLVELGGETCKFSFIGGYFSQRRIYEIAMVAASTLSLCGEAYVAYRLRKTYLERPWRVVEVPSETHRMYRQLLWFSVAAQLAALFVPATNAMWAYLLLSTWFRDIVGNHWAIYGTVFIIISAVFPLWMGLGWFALRRENRKMTTAFLMIGVILLGLCISATASAMFMWSLTTWWFFGSLYTIALIFFGGMLVMAVVCRRNFGNNLDHYLVVKSRLAAMGFTHGEFERDKKMDNVRTLSYVSRDSSATLVRTSLSWDPEWKAVPL